MPIKLTLTPCFKFPLPFSDSLEAGRVALYFGNDGLPAGIVDIEEFYMTPPEGGDNSIYNELIRGNEVVVELNVVKQEK